MLVVLLKVSEAIKHLRCALGVSYVSDLLVTGDVCYVVERGWDVILAHFLPVEIPILFLIFPRVVLRVPERERVAARVAQPHIVASTRCNKRWRDIVVVHDPAVGGVEQPMLEENWRFALGEITSFTWDSVLS